MKVIVADVQRESGRGCVLAWVRHGNGWKLNRWSFHAKHDAEFRFWSGLVLNALGRQG